MHPFLKEYLEWYEQAINAYGAGVAGRRYEPPYRGIALIGMGGSGIVNDIIYSITYAELEVPVVVIKDFNLPRWVGRGWLVVAVSYSGNTVETLLAVKEALGRGCCVATVSSGGDLARVSRSEGIPHVVIEGGRTPRSSLPSLLVSTLRLLEELGVHTSVDVLKDIEVLKDVEGSLRAAEDLANALRGVYPFFIANTRYLPLALRAKNEFNENAKALAKAAALPEWGHNDVVGWEGRKDGVAAVIFREPGDDLMGFAAELLRGVGARVVDVVLSEGGYVRNVLKYSQVVGIASVLRALSEGLDPVKTVTIARYRGFLKGLLER